MKTGFRKEALKGGWKVHVRVLIFILIGIREKGNRAEIEVHPIFIWLHLLKSATFSICNKTSTYYFEGPVSSARMCNFNHAISLCYSRL
jgi:hypothetical protein